MSEKECSSQIDCLKQEVAHLRENLINCMCDLKIVEIILSDALSQLSEPQQPLLRLLPTVERIKATASSRADLAFLSRLWQRARRLQNEVPDSQCWNEVRWKMNKED